MGTFYFTRQLFFGGFFGGMSMMFALPLARCAALEQKIKNTP